MTKWTLSRAEQREIMPALRAEILHAFYLERMLPIIARETRQGRRYTRWKGELTLKTLVLLRSKLGIEANELICPLVEACWTEARRARSESGLESMDARLASVFNQLLSIRSGRLVAILAMLSRLVTAEALPVTRELFDRMNDEARRDHWLPSQFGSQAA